MKTNTVPPQAFPPAFPITIEGTWFVKTGASIQSLTLDELDEKFQRGELNAKTPVFTSGMTAWDTLGAIADLDDAGDNAATAMPSARIIEDLSEALEPLDGDSFPPMTAGVFGTDGPRWASGASSEKEGYTVVRRSTAGMVPFPVRKAVGALADYVAELRLSRPRLVAVGPWLFGAALSGIFIFSLYQLSASSSRPGAHTKVTARAIPVETHSAAAAIPPGISPSPSSPAPSNPAPARAASSSEHDESPQAGAAPREDDAEPGAVDVLRSAELPTVESARSDAQLTRSARSKVKSKAWSARKAKARASRRAAKRASKNRKAASLY
jgi:hypothetical protein